jgi:anti-sigma-K factor RskA
MNYQRPQLLDELAAQYVLGTLRGLARRRFERFCHHNPGALHAVRRWEDRFVELLAGVEPVAPSALVWERVKFRIRRDHSRTRRDDSLRPKRPFATLSNWRISIAAGFAAFAIAFGAWTGFGPGSSQLVATVSDQQAQLWRIEATRDRDALRVSAVENLSLDPARAYELWALPGEGAAPVSLGLMPKSGRDTLQLNDAQRLALSRSRQIAVSLEPPGGSPTGAPTGPVLFVADVTAAG